MRGGGSGITLSRDDGRGRSAFTLRQRILVEQVS